MSVKRLIFHNTHRQLPIICVKKCDFYLADSLLCETFTLQIAIFTSPTP
jgi:hypothetical protein